jgi:hypothetical protein
LQAETVVPGRKVVADRITQVERLRRMREESEKLAAQAATGDKRVQAEVRAASESTRHAGTEATFRAVAELWEFQRTTDVRDILRELCRIRLHHHAAAIEAWTSAAAAVETLDPEDALRLIRAELQAEPPSTATGATPRRVDAAAAFSP